jgi:membrane protease YdiL (CAAX protease family)
MFAAPLAADWPRRAIAAALAAAAAIGISLVVGLLNIHYFDAINRVVNARDPVVRALLFSSWLTFLALPPLLLRPQSIGLTLGTSIQRWRLILASLAGGALATAVLLAMYGATPYSGAPLLVETVVVPISEELFFRGLLLGALIATFGILFGERRRVALLAVVTNGLAFGVAHLANLVTVAPSFVIAQATFATFLGTACAALAVSTRSVWPAVALHAIVNGVVVLAS